MTPNSHRHIRYVWDSQCVSKMQRPGSLLVQCDCDGGCKIKSSLLRRSAGIQFSLCKPWTIWSSGHRWIHCAEAGHLRKVFNSRWVGYTWCKSQLKWPFLQQSLCNETAFKGWSLKSLSSFQPSQRKQHFFRNHADQDAQLCANHSASANGPFSANGLFPNEKWTTQHFC